MAEIECHVTTPIVLTSQMHVSKSCHLTWAANVNGARCRGALKREMERVGVAEACVWVRKASEPGIGGCGVWGAVGVSVACVLCWIDGVRARNCTPGPKAIIHSVHHLIN